MVTSQKLRILVWPALNAYQNARNGSLPKISLDTVIVSKDVNTLC